MSRNSSGTYSLPAGNPVVSGTTISATTHNNTMSDLATEVTDSLNRSGKGGMLAVLRGVDGAVSGPAFSWTSDTDTGIYRIGADNPAMAVGGTKVQEWGATNTIVTSTNFIVGASSKFTVVGASGNTVISGTLAVTGQQTFTGTATFNGGVIVPTGQAALLQGTAVISQTLTFTAPTFANSWVNFGGSNATAGYSLNAGMVYLTGVIKSGVVGSAAFTLPSGYRPSGDLTFAVSSNDLFGIVKVIASTGNVVPQVGSNVYFSLCGISFPAA